MRYICLVHMKLVYLCTLRALLDIRASLNVTEIGNFFTLSFSILRARTRVVIVI